MICSPCSAVRESFNYEVVCGKKLCLILMCDLNPLELKARFAAIALCCIMFLC